MIKPKQIISLLFVIALLAVCPLAKGSTGALANAAISAQHGGVNEESVEIVVEEETQPVNESKLPTILLAVAMLGFIFFAKWGGKKKPAAAIENPAAAVDVPAVQTQQAIPGEILAAISAAIYELNENQHDTENAVLTIRPANQNYSPWNSKSLTLKRSPRK